MFYKSLCPKDFSDQKRGAADGSVDHRRAPSDQLFHQWALQSDCSEHRAQSHLTHQLQHDKHTHSTFYLWHMKSKHVSLRMLLKCCMCVMSVLWNLSHKYQVMMSVCVLYSMWFGSRWPASALHSPLVQSVTGWLLQYQTHSGWTSYPTHPSHVHLFCFSGREGECGERRRRRQQPPI